MFLKLSAASASTSANTASINVSNTAEPAQQGERQDSEEYEQEEDEEVDMDSCVTVSVFYALGLCIVLVQLFIAWEFTLTITWAIRIACSLHASKVAPPASKFKIRGLLKNL